MTLVMTTAAPAQSSFMREGESGWEVSGQIGAGSGVTSGSVTAGYSSRGLVDASISVSESGFPNPYPVEFGTDRRIVTGTAFSETFTSFVMKQNYRGSPVSLAVSGGCCFGSFSAPGSQTEEEMKVGNTYMRYGASVYREFHASDKVFIQPGLSVSYWEGFGVVAEPSLTTQVNSDFVRFITAFVSIGIPVSHASVLVVSPALDAYEKAAVFSLNAALVFPYNGSTGR